MSFVVQPISPSCDILAQLDKRSNPFPWTTRHYQDSLNAGHHFWGILYPEQNELYGFAVIMPIMDEAELLNLVIDQAYQHQGLGYQLLHQLQAQLTQQGFRKLMLEVRHSHLAAQALYRRCGFYPVGYRKAYYPLPNSDRKEDALLMEACL